MPRQRHPWFRKDRNSWFVEVDGKQVPLGEHPADAPTPKKSKTTKLWNAPPAIMAKFGQQMIDHEKKADADPTAPKGTVVFLLGRFLSWTKKHKAEATYQQRRHFLKSFVKFKNVRLTPPQQITIDLVEQWLDAHPKWKSSRRHAILCLLRALNWAVKRKLLATNPITGIEVPAQTRVLAYLTTEQRKSLFDATKDKAFKNVLTAL